MNEGTKKKAKEEVEHEGKEIKLNGVEYILPPLSFGHLRKFKNEILDIQRFELGDITEDEQKEGSMFLLRYTPLIHAALKRNYPEITLEEVEDALDLGDMNGGPRSRIGEIFKALFGVSNVDEVKKLGETPAVAPKRSTGRRSTAS